MAGEDARSGWNRPFIYQTKLLLIIHTTYNPNMPLRDLIYVSGFLADIVKEENLYGTAQVKIPVPQFVTFYNGVGQQPERLEMKLSDAYKVFTKQPQLELKCIMINLNKGCNKGFMDKCRTLREYMIFVDKVRDYQKEMTLENALDLAIDECIKEQVLEDFFRSEKAKVRSMSVLEFNLERQLDFMREEGKSEGSNLKIISQVCKKLQKGKNEIIIAEELEEELEYVQRICAIAVKYAPDYDVDKIYKELQSQVA